MNFSELDSFHLRSLFVEISADLLGNLKALEEINLILTSRGSEAILSDGSRFISSHCRDLLKKISSRKGFQFC